MHSLNSVTSNALTNDQFIRDAMFYQSKEEESISPLYNFPSSFTQPMHLQLFSVDSL